MIFLYEKSEVSYGEAVLADSEPDQYSSPKIRSSKEDAPECQTF